MTAGCIVFAHRNPDQLALLLSLLRHPRIRAYVHIDSRSPLAPFAAALRDGPEAVALARRRTRWGGVEIVDAMLDAIAAALRDGCDYLLVVSGQDLPLHSPATLLDLIAESPDTSFIEHFPLPADNLRLGGRDRIEFYTYTVFGRRETCLPAGEDTGHLSWKGRLLNQLLRARSMPKPPRRFPTYVRPYWGSTWWNLSRPAARYVLQFVSEHPDYRRYHRYTQNPDELFIHSILAGSEFAETHEVVSDSRRYLVWPEGSSHPRTLTMDDLPRILASDNLFARKFDMTADAEVIARLAEAVRR